MSDKYGTGHDKQYCYPNSDTLINKLGLTDGDSLEAAEIEHTQARIEQFLPDFDDISLSALRAIHFHIFQDIYDWAGELRTVDISKGSTRFANISRIEPEAEKLFRLLAQEDYLIDLPRNQFLTRLAYYYGELNVIHPFRDGNGRAQRLLFEVISINAGYALRWEPIGRAEWVAANIEAYHCRLEPLKALLNRALTRI
ncbi:putative adenosine monophosphate-protein transferase Fic [Undibacterium rugosum]|uniref:protein adenylyltransferase n=1 Tax=Undibacterium rugosum TaxID=2762291 RepID=A0A923KZU6_9BURK|nr:putative adenosine monophosphate-protein transferase Fic [Undibacterium rugosum]MBC3936650.1 putative adenosine monophosphate-protein transferase Fic [Undibacterium rugosum]MBR7776974.1 putative adenosine monophosphate-protein transferase Fic [Undibacterium rugosum]